jgi:ankyrin repeat protein
MEPEASMPLHVAAATAALAESPDAAMEHVAALLASSPSAAALADGLGLTPLAWACAKEAPAGVVSILLDAHPGAAHERSTGGMLPLHWAAQSRASLEVVTMLLSLRAAHACERDSLGRLPLHAAAGGGASVAVLDALLEAHPTGGGEEDALGRQPLHHAAGNGAPAESVAYLLRAYPRAASARDRRGRTPLHTAAAKRAPAGAILALLEAYPEAAAARDSDGRLPLHYAASRQASSEAVAHLLSFHAAAAAERARGGMLPLHLAAACAAPPTVVAQLVNAYPDGLREPGGTGRLALHMAAAGGAPLDSLAELLAAYPDGARVRDADGRLALHCAAEAHAPPEVVGQLLAAWPESPRVAHGGVRPLTRWLLKADPDAIGALATTVLHSAPVMRAAMHDLVRHAQFADLVRMAVLEDPELPYVAEEGASGVGAAGSGGGFSASTSAGDLKGAPPSPAVMPPQPPSMAATPRGSVASLVALTGSPGGASGGNGGAGGTGRPSSEARREALDVACPECRRVMLQAGYFLRRYELLCAPPPPGVSASTPGYMPTPLVAYASGSTRVLLAIDTWADERSPARHVALKCMRRPAKLAREAARRRGLSAEAVVPLLRAHSPPGGACGAEGSGPASLQEEAALRGVWPHIAVLPRCDTSLAAALSARAGGPRAPLPRRDWDAARRVAHALALASQNLHDASLIHADIKPSNILFHAGTWKLSDLDAACSVNPRAGEYISDRVSSAFAPPETVYFSEDGAGGAPSLRVVPERGVLEAWEPASLKASVSYDMWAYGAVLYHVVAGVPLWPDVDKTGGADCVPPEALRRLAAWDAAALEARLAPLLREPLSDDIPARVASSANLLSVAASAASGAASGAFAPPDFPPVSPAASRDAAVALLRWLLQPSPRARPASMSAVLRHKFLDPASGLDRAALSREPSGGLYGALYAAVPASLSAAALTAVTPGGMSASLWRGMSTALAYATAARNGTYSGGGSGGGGGGGGGGAGSAAGEDAVPSPRERSFNGSRSGGGGGGFSTPKGSPSARRARGCIPVPPGTPPDSPAVTL